MTKLGLFVAPIKIKCFSFDRYDQCWFYCFTLINKEELIGWHPSGFTRARIQVIEIEFSELLIKGMEI